MNAPRTFVDVMRGHARRFPRRPVLAFLRDGRNEERRATYGELDRRAKAVAARLRSLGLTGKPVLICCPPGLEFVEAILGCLYAGAISVPAHSLHPASLKRSLPRLKTIAADAGARHGLTTKAHAPLLEKGSSELGALARVRWQHVDAVKTSEGRGWTAPALTPESLAMLQYTSGSTGRPRGVMLTHGNILSTQEMIRAAFGNDSRARGANWLPPYHDMGLIGNILQPLYIRGLCAIMPPITFLADPSRWLEALTRYKGTTAGAPNFAYDLCVDKIPAAERKRLDLSRWKLAYTGAEPIRAETLTRFARAFRPAGFRPSAFLPVYGLAEATLLVTGERREKPLVLRADARALGAGVAHAARRGAPARAVVSCGIPAPGQTVLIFDPATRRELPEGRVGEIWVSGPNVAAGYWKKPRESARVFRARAADGRGPFLRTGDLGFIRGGRLFPCGRIKDVIVIQGRNHFPEDLERAVEDSHPSLRPHSCAAFAVDGPRGETAAAAVEWRGRWPADEKEKAAAREAALRAVRAGAGMELKSLVIVRGGSVPRTSSGKIQRGACRALFLAGKL